MFNPKLLIPNPDPSLERIRIQQLVSAAYYQVEGHLPLDQFSDSDLQKAMHLWREGAVFSGDFEVLIQPVIAENERRYGAGGAA